MLLKIMFFLTNYLQDKMDINMGTVTFSSERLEWAGLLKYSIRFVYF